MSTTELENWLSKVKNFSINELLTAQEIITQELRTKTVTLQHPSEANDTVSQPSNSRKIDTPIAIQELLGPDLPPELIKEISALALLEDEALWKAARSHLPIKSANKFRQLNYKQQKEGRTSLSQQELESLEKLGYEYDRYILIRSYAALILKERGHDIASLGPT